MVLDTFSSETFRSDNFTRNTTPPSVLVIGHRGTRGNLEHGPAARGSSNGQLWNCVVLARWALAAESVRGGVRDSIYFDTPPSGFPSTGPQWCSRQLNFLQMACRVTASSAPIGARFPALILAYRGFELREQGVHNSNCIPVMLFQHACYSFIRCNLEPCGPARFPLAPNIVTDPPSVVK